MDNELMVQIPLDEYRSLVADQTKLEVLYDAAFRGVSLGYRDGLCVNSSDLAEAALILFPLRAEQERKRLLAERDGEEE